MPPAASVKSTIFVGGLSQAVTVRTLQDAFVPFGEIADIKLPKPDHPSAKEPHRGFAYIKFEEEADASEAVDNMDRSELYGRILKVAAAKPQRENNEGLNSKTAIWHQEGYLAKHTVSQEDRDALLASAAEDPMQGLEGLDEAGPKAE